MLFFSCSFAVDGSGYLARAFSFHRMYLLTIFCSYRKLVVDIVLHPHKSHILVQHICKSFHCFILFLIVTTLAKMIELTIEISDSTFYSTGGRYSTCLDVYFCGFVSGILDPIYRSTPCVIIPGYFNIIVPTFCMVKCLTSTSHSTQDLVDAVHTGSFKPVVVCIHTTLSHLTTPVQLSYLFAHRHTRSRSRMPAPRRGARASCSRLSHRQLK